MASSDLERYFNIILSAEGGEEVRDAIINAAKLMKSITKNAGSLGGHTPDYFALANPYLIWYETNITKFGFDDIDDLSDADYARDSTNVVSSGTLYGVLLKYMKPAFKNIFNYENDPNDSKKAEVAVTDYLSKLFGIKSDIGKALKAKGKKLTQAKDFRYYAELIRTIDEGIPELVDPDDFTENKEYDAMQGKTYPAAYSRFRVKLDKTKYLVEGSGDENGKTYTPPEGKLFSSFNVNIKTRSGVNSTVRSATGKRGKSSTGEDDILDENGMLENFVITANDTYYASDEGAEGFRSVSVHVTEPEVGDQKFTVTFYNGEEQLGDPVTVIAYDSAYYDGPTPVSKEDPDNKIFSGWIPSPLRVTQNLDCQAQFIDRTAPSAGEITDSWTEIVRNRGANYDFGSYKSLTIGTIGGKNYGTLIMEKVGMGEGPSTSTWLSKTCFNKTLVGNPFPWPESDARTFLNNTLLEYMAKTPDGEAIVNGLVPVRKACITAFPRSVYDGKVSYGILHTTDRIWIPSFAEMFGTENYATAYEEAIRLYHEETRIDAMGPSYPSEDLRDSYCYADNSSASVSWETYEMSPGRHELRYTITSPEWFTKYSCSNTSQQVTYGTRSVGHFGHANLSTYYYPQFYSYSSTHARIDQSGEGLISDFPIGFCL